MLYILTRGNSMMSKAAAYSYHARLLLPQGFDSLQATRRGAYALSIRTDLKNKESLNILLLPLLWNYYPCLRFVLSTSVVD